MKQMKCLLHLVLLFLLCSSCSASGISGYPIDLLSPMESPASEIVTPIVETRVIVQRQSISIIDKIGQPHELIYYDKPVLYDSVGGSNATEMINRYYMEESEKFLTDSGAKEILQIVGSDPYNDTSSTNWVKLTKKMTTEITYNADSLFSVKQGYCWFAGGVISLDDTCAVFSLETGEKLALSHFIKMDFETFEDKLFTFCFEALRRENPWSPSGEELVEQYGKLDFESYEFYYEAGEVFILLRGPKSTSELNRFVCWSTAENQPVRVEYGYSALPYPLQAG